MLQPYRTIALVPKPLPRAWYRTFYLKMLIFVLGTWKQRFARHCSGDPIYVGRWFRFLRKDKIRQKYLTHAMRGCVKFTACKNSNDSCWNHKFCLAVRGTHSGGPG